MDETEKYRDWQLRLMTIAEEMRAAEFDMDALDDLAGIVDMARDRCDELMS